VSSVNRDAIAAYLMACISTVSGPIAFQLGDDQPTIGSKAEHVETVTFADAAKRLPPVELERHDQNAVADDLGVRDHPLLQVRPLP